jgi:molybdate transport system substrate-binding protein
MIPKRCRLFEADHAIKTLLGPLREVERRMRMLTCVRQRWSAGVGCGLILAAALSARTAVADDIRVFSSGAPAEVVQRLAARFAQETGHRVLFTVANPATIQRRLAAGESADIVILPAPIITSLEAAGAMHPGSRVDLARVGVGVVVREGAPRPGISTVDAVRQLLLDARSIVFPDPSGGGQTGAALARMIARLGVADAVRPKLTLMQAIAGGVALVANGDAEVGMFNISEVLPVKGVTLVGPLPPELQSYIVFTAAIPASNAAPAPAQAFIKLLSDPVADADWKAGGLESMRGGS